MNPGVCSRRMVLALGLLLAFLSPAPAQETGDKPSMVRFTVWGDWKGKDLHIRRAETASKTDDGFIKLELLDLGYSSAVPFRRGNPLELCTPLEKDGKTIWQPVITVTIPDGIREPLVMIFPQENGEASARVFDLHSSAFPYGGYQLVNLSKVQLLARLDDAIIRVEPGTSGQFKGSSDGSKNVWLRLAVEHTDKSAKVIYSSMMKNRSDKRMFLFFHTTDASPETPIAVRTLVDFAQAPGQ